MTRRFDIVCFGEPLVEFTRLPGQTDHPHFVQGFGGDTSNTAIAAARQGARVACIGALGRDWFGDAIVDLWESEGIEGGSVIRHAEAPTGLYFVLPHAEERHFEYRRAGSAASAFTRRDLDAESIAASHILHTSAITMAISPSSCDAVFAAIEIAHAAGTLVSIDTNLRTQLWSLSDARHLTHEAMERCDIALPSLDDSRSLTGLSDADGIVDFYLDLGATVVALKMGGRGALVATAANRQHFPPHPVQAVDVTGAGDTFDGVFLARYRQSGSAFAAARYAVTAAALSTTGYGAVTPMPSLAAVEAAMVPSD